MRSAHRAAALVLCLVPAAPSAAGAESIFSSVGFGRWLHTTDVRAAALGDVSIVAPSAYTYSPRNPAVLAFVERASGYASVVSEFTRVGGGIDTETRTDSRIPLVGVGIPIAGSLAAGLSVYSVNDARYDISQEVAGDPPYTLRTSGEGAFTQVAAAVAYRFGDVALGVQLALPFTAFEERVARSFETDGFVGREELRTTELDDVVFTTFGVHAKLGPARLGAFFQLPVEGTMATRSEIGPARISDAFALGIPLAFGVGGAWVISEHLTVLAELRRQAWSEAEVDGASWRELPPADRFVRGFKDQDAFGGGVEWRPGTRATSPYWRVGYAQEPWITAGPGLGRVLDRSITAGFGVPFREDNGELGLALRFTARRETGRFTLGLEEDVVALTLGLSFARQPRAF